MTFEWRCKRASEAWPAQLPNASYQPYVSSAGGGCFGDVGGPAQLGFAAASDLTFEPSYLEPLVNYDVQFVVMKDTRSATAEVTLFVQQPAAPVITARSVHSPLYLLINCRRKDDHVFTCLSVCLSVCLFVCMLTGLLRSY